MYLEFLTYRQQYGKIITQEQILKRIKCLELEKSIHIISFLITNQHKPNFLRTISTNCKIKVKEHEAIYTLQSLLYLTKYIYLYSMRGEPKYEFTYSEVKDIIEIQWMLNDYILELTDKNLLLYNMIKFNYKVNHKALITRTWYMYTVLAKDENLNSETYIDVNKGFFDKYNYSIEEYLYTYFCLYIFLYKPEYVSGIIDIENHFNNASNNDKCTKVLFDICCDAEKFKEFAQSNINNYWSYEILTTKPILQIDSDIGVVLSYIHLQENIIENLNNKLDSLYCQNVFKQHFGHVFEKYVQKVCIRATLESDYNYKNEFNIRKGLRSSDAYIYKDNKMIIIEVKSKYMKRKRLFTDCNATNIYSNIKDQFVSPIHQIDDRCQDIKKSKWDLLDNINEIYAISVNFENCHLAVPEYHEYAMHELFMPVKRKQHIRTNEIKYFFCFSIDELESLCYLLENREDIFGILKDFYSYSNIFRFSDYLISNGIEVKYDTKLIVEEYCSFIEICNKFLNR